MRTIISIFFLSFATYVIAQSSCSVNPSVAENCTTGCYWTTPEVWSCAGNTPKSFPNGAADDAHVTYGGQYQINLWSDDPNIPTGPISLNNFYVGYGTVNGNDTQIVSIKSVSMGVAATLRVYAAGTLDLDLQAETLTTGTAQVSPNGLLVWRSGTLASTTGTTQFSVLPGGQFVATGTSGTKTLTQSLSNDGYLKFDDGSVVLLDGSATIYNSGTLELTNGGSIAASNYQNIASSGRILVTRTSGAGWTNIGASLQALGTFEVASGSAQIQSNATFINLQVNAGATCAINAGSNLVSITNINATGAFAWNGGDLRISGAGRINVAPTSSVTITAPNRLFSLDGTGQFNNDGTVNVLVAGTTSIEIPFWNSGAIIASSGILQFRTLRFFELSTVYGAARFEVQNLQWETGSLAGTGQFVITGASNIASGTKTLTSRQLVFSAGQSSVAASPLYLKSGATITIEQAATVQFNGATIASEAGSTFVNSGSILGGVSIYGTFSNAGNIGPVTPGNAGVSLYVNGSVGFQPTSNIYIDLWSTTASNYINIDGVAALDGTITIRNRVGFYGSSGMAIKVFRASSSTGQFANVVIDNSNWDNPTQCQQITTAWNTDSSLTIFYAGCTSGAAPPPAKSNLGTFAIVVVVIAVIIIAIGLIAWCQKKYRKRPWDRLKDERIRP